MNMNYAALIQNRKSTREFTGEHVSPRVMGDIERYFQEKSMRLLPQLETRLLTFGTESREALEGAAGYESFLVGAPAYMVLLSAEHERSGENAGFIMEDLILKLADMGLDSCWLTFTEGERVKEALEIVSTLQVAAVVAFGYGVKTTRRLRVNIRSMSNVDVQAKRRYHEPKRSVYELAYLNRQAYGFVLHDGGVTLVRKSDAYTPDIDARLSLGAVLQHFTAVASRWAGELRWSFENPLLALPEGHEAVATAKV